MKHLYFTRHAERHGRTGGNGSTDIKALTDVGKWHAVAAGTDARSRDLSFDLIISSPLPHALHTAQLIADEIGYNPNYIKTSDLLLGFGWSRPQQHQPGHVIAPSSELYFQPHNGEAKAVVQARAKKILDHLQDRPEKSILLVGHNAFGQALHQLTGTELPITDYEHGELPHARILQFI